MTHNPPIHYPVPDAFADLPHLTKDIYPLSRDQFVTALYNSCSDLSNITAEPNGVDHHDPISILNLKVQLMNGYKKELTTVLNTDCMTNKVMITDCNNGFIATDIKNGIFDPVMIKLKTKNGDNIGVIDKAKHNFIQGDPMQRILDILKNYTHTKKLGDTLQNDPATKKGKNKIRQQQEEQQQQILSTSPPSAIY